MIAGRRHGLLAKIDDFISLEEQKNTVCVRFRNEVRSLLCNLKVPALVRQSKAPVNQGVCVNVPQEREGAIWIKQFYPASVSFRREALWVTSL